MLYGISGNKLNFQSVFADISKTIQEKWSQIDLRALIGPKMPEIGIDSLKAKITELLGSQTTLASVQERLKTWFASFSDTNVKLSPEELAELLNAAELQV